MLASDSESKYYLHNAVDGRVPPPGCTILGTSANEAISGTSADDVICAGGGNDTIVGSGGNDTLNSKDGVNGNDSLAGGAGTDTKVTYATEKFIVGFPYSGFQYG